MKIITLGMILLLILSCPAFAQDQRNEIINIFLDQIEHHIKISGYYKNLYSTSKTTATKDNFFADTNRLRLQLDWEFTDSLALLMIYDNQIIFNDFSKNADFATIRQKNQKDLNFLDTDHTISDKDHYYWTHKLHRAYLKYTNPQLQITTGKQAIDWSRMRLYHPFDLFNAISPLDIEKDEKIGVDALNIEYFPAAASTINFIYLPYKNSSRTSFGLRLGKKINDYDLFVIGAEHEKDEVAGLGFDGYLWDAGLRGEVTYTHKDNKKEFFRTVVGMDYNFTPKLYGLIEYFYNGGAEKDTAAFLGSYKLSKDAISIRKHILGFGLEYELTGILKLTDYIFYDFEGESFFINPELKINAKTNLDFILGLQLFGGDSESEFGSYHRLLYLELKKYF